MRHFKSYITLLLLTAISLLSGCSDNFDTPPMMVPKANRVPNITIADLKAKYWQDDANYIATVDEDLVIAGRLFKTIRLPLPSRLTAPASSTPIASVRKWL